MTLTETQAQRLSDNGWQALVDFVGFTTDDIEKWCKSTSRSPINRGGCQFSTISVRRICALAYWVNRLHLRGKAIDPAEWTGAAMTQALLDYPIYDLELEAADAVDKPELFSYEKWEDWQESVITYLKGKKNVTKNVPLYYVIRPDTAPNNPTEEEDIIFNASRTGAAYRTDNKTVHSLLAELTNGTEADTWIKSHRRSQDGRQAWNDLVGHYDGPAEGDKRVTVARNDIKVIHYKNESSFSFEKYSTRLKKAFSTLAQYEQGKSEKEKVDILLSQINNNNPEIITAIGICRNNHSTTFEEACTYMSQQVVLIYPQHQPNAFGRRGKGGKRPTVRSIQAVRTKNGRTTCNGVDLTDTTRYFSEKEFQKIGKEGRAYLQKCPKRKAQKEEHAANKRRNIRNNTIDERQVAAVINGVINATRHENDSVANSSISSEGGGGSRAPQHGSRARQAAAANTGGGSSTGGNNRRSVRYDHNGNIVHE